MTSAQPAGSDGVVLLGWKTRDAALAVLQEDCEFDPPLDDVAAERLWARYRERVNVLRGRALPAAALLSFSDEERRVVDEFLEEVARHGGVFRDVIKVDPLFLAAHQLEISTERSRTTAARLRTPTEWASECLCPAGSSACPTIRGVPNSVDVDLPHGEYALLFDATLGLVLGEAARCITVTSIGARRMLWSGYHRAYASAAYRFAGERTILAAIADDSGQASRARTCGLRAVQSDNPPIVADFFDPDVALPVRFKAKRFTMEIRARVVAAHVKSEAG
jgi:hypothetical protein